MKFEVPASHAAISPADLGSAAGRPSIDFARGSPVIIASGIHEGKTGIVSDVNYKFVLVTEDMTSIQVNMLRLSYKSYQLKLLAVGSSAQIGKVSKGDPSVGGEREAHRKDGDNHTRRRTRFVHSRE